MHFVEEYNLLAGHFVEAKDQQVVVRSGCQHNLPDDATKKQFLLM
jgi:hypothetical protein